MAGNAKQYNELEQATTVNDTDLFAVAQEDSNELKTVTTMQVAERVAEIVSTDQVQELISDLAMGKQVLAQELNNKGADVTASDTLTTMASKVQDFDVVGAKEYVAPRVVRAQMGAVAAPASTSSYTWALPYKRALLCIDPSTKLISVKNIPSGSTTWNTISSITDSELPTSGYAMLSSSKDGSYVVIATRTSNIYSLYAYTITDDGIISKHGSVIVTTNAYSQTSAGGVWISNDGTYVYHYGTNSSGGGNTDIITRYTIATGESKVYTAPMVSTGRAYFMQREYRYMLNDSTLCSIWIQAGSVSVVFGHIDEDNSYITVDPESTILSSSYTGYGTCPALKDNLLFIYGTTPERDGTGVCNVYDVTDFSLITTLRVARQYMTWNTNYSNFGWYDTYSNVQFIYHEDTQTYDIYSSALGAVTYDVNSKTLRLTYPSTGAVTGTGAVYNISLIFMPPNSNYNAYAGNPLCSYISDDLILVGNGQSVGASVGSDLQYSGSVAVTMYSPEEYLCLGILYKRNGQQIRYRINYFIQSEYESGAYALKSTEAVLNISQGGDE